MTEKPHRSNGYYWLIPNEVGKAFDDLRPRVWQIRDGSHAQIGRYEWFPTNYDGDFPWTLHGLPGICAEDEIQYNFTVGALVGPLEGPAGR